MATSKAPEALPPEDCVRRIQSLVLADLRPVRPLPSEGWLLVAIGVVWVAVVCAGFWFYGGYGWSALSRQRQVAIFFPLAVAASLMALAAVRQMSPGSGDARIPAIGAGAAFTVLLAVLASSYSLREELHFLRTGLNCFGVGCLFTAIAGAAVWRILRRGAIFQAPIALAMAGIAAACVLEVRCPNPNLLHILLCHVSLATCSMAAGVFTSANRSRP